MSGHDVSFTRRCGHRPRTCSRIRLRCNTVTGTAKRPLHEAMTRRTRRARHGWQVFGLAGAHRWWCS
ncbi:hypothetical protein I547_3616 [Mycobacterium kansasii 824]|uniref:Uncharacterized protein n=1 Tax=Mycobacterium kansasii TaxID=1768 RepID=A0A1V3XH39_MYCKA|nr:hypothetical protein I547_3616 [Mycobacterium kansasii 824]KEP44777.1 hypothetical protein MKSMC1_00850 [Mycobacterium kansasii]OOK78410.1 hypothetical protein BZL30_2539 [Mycobacterium kansasii]